MLRRSTMLICITDQAAPQLRSALGATSESEPQDKPYGHRNAGVVDQNGVTWWIAAPVK
jgi:uncharacterized glyoxalase superfamily protein PhnB